MIKCICKAHNNTKTHLFHGSDQTSENYFNIMLKQSSPGVTRYCLLFPCCVCVLLLISENDSFLTSTFIDKSGSWLMCHALALPPILWWQTGTEHILHCQSKHWFPSVNHCWLSAVPPPNTGKYSMWMGKSSFELHSLDVKLLNWLTITVVASFLLKWSNYVIVSLLLEVMLM